MNHNVWLIEYDSHYLSQFNDEERKVAKEVLESLILKHNAKRAFADQLNTSS